MLLKINNDVNDTSCIKMNSTFYDEASIMLDVIQTEAVLPYKPVLMPMLSHVDVLLWPLASYAVCTRCPLAPGMDTQWFNKRAM